MNELTIIYVLAFIIAVLIPLFGVLAKDGAKLFRDIKEALNDGKLSDTEIDLILADTGILLSSIVKLIEAILIRLGRM